MVLFYSGYNHIWIFFFSFVCTILLTAIIMRCSFVLYLFYFMGICLLLVGEDGNAVMSMFWDWINWTLNLAADCRWPCHPWVQHVYRIHKCNKGLHWIFSWHLISEHSTFLCVRHLLIDTLFCEIDMGSIDCMDVITGRMVGNPQTH